MVAADGLPSRTDCTVLATSEVDISSEASPSALVEDTSAYDIRYEPCRMDILGLGAGRARATLDGVNCSFVWHYGRLQL